MSPQAIGMLPVSLDSMLTVSAVAPTQPSSGEAGEPMLSRLAERAQDSLQSAAAPLDILRDPARRNPLTTGELLTLQAAVSDYSVTLLTLSHLAQSAGSAIQSLTQRT
ncbi:hypothetical protein AWB77_02627 [Caballeronia fortuita]|uniref:Type III secretion system protein n=1 Tax=Caballeronia fortuita TaxID=1777138 RepID=A0A158BBU8_9BURK|nr:hypothetical protein [Caballeronia fortuita]SAK67542.1 hypothetical protein AWB77_02627 [Caballeronia fortuita]